MCDEAEGACPVWLVRTVRARKTHQCLGCRETIAVGQDYRVTESLWEGAWSRWKHCNRCARLFDLIDDESRSQGILAAVDPGLDCGETWEQAFCEAAPSWAAALAFALPGDPVILSGGEAAERLGFKWERRVRR